MKTSKVRWLTVLAATALGAALLPITGAAGFPVAENSTQYSVCGRVFRGSAGLLAEPGAGAGAVAVGEGQR